MTLWKHFIILFGGFYDPGIRSQSVPFLPRLGLMSSSGRFFLWGVALANYLKDLWLFDTQEYIWRQVEFRETGRTPS